MYNVHKWMRGRVTVDSIFKILAMYIINKINYLTDSSNNESTFS